MIDPKYIILVAVTIALIMIVIFTYYSKFRHYRINKDSNLKINMNDLISSIHESKELYNRLSKSCHPDRFIGNDNYELAESIFKEITENKRNYKSLKALENRAKNELNIKIN